MPAGEGLRVLAIVRMLGEGAFGKVFAATLPPARGRSRRAAIKIAGSQGGRAEREEVLGILNSLKADVQKGHTTEGSMPPGAATAAPTPQSATTR